MSSSHFDFIFYSFSPSAPLTKCTSVMDDVCSPLLLDPTGAEL